MARIKLDRSHCEYFIKYLKSCISNDAKTVDSVKEYLLARHVQNVIYKAEIILLKYQMGQNYKAKTIGITDLEIIALNNYFSRYQTHSFLIPLEESIHEAMRVNYPTVVNVLSNNINWPTMAENM